MSTYKEAMIAAKHGNKVIRRGGRRMVYDYCMELLVDLSASSPYATDAKDRAAVDWEIEEHEVKR